MERVVTEEGIDVQDVLHPRLIPWDHVTRSRISDEMAIIHVRSDAYIFPRRLFSSDEDWRRFCGLVNTKTLQLGAV